MKEVIRIVAALAAGGVITSTAEYKLGYNLVDLIMDKVKEVLAYVKSKV